MQIPKRVKRKYKIPKKAKEEYKSPKENKEKIDAGTHALFTGNCIILSGNGNLYCQLL